MSVKTTQTLFPKTFATLFNQLYEYNFKHDGKERR